MLINKKVDNPIIYLFDNIFKNISIKNALISIIFPEQNTLYNYYQYDLFLMIFELNLCYNDK